MSFKTPLTIKEAIENIENNKFLLPSIQREFVWEHTKIEWLFDSLMRNYPISSFLLWQVESEVKKGYKFYKFISKYREKFKTHNSEISVDGIIYLIVILVLSRCLSNSNFPNVSSQTAGSPGPDFQLFVPDPPLYSAKT